MLKQHNLIDAYVTIERATNQKTTDTNKMHSSSFINSISDPYTFETKRDEIITKTRIDAIWTDKATI